MITCCLLIPFSLPLQAAQLQASTDGVAPPPLSLPAPALATPQPSLDAVTYPFFGRLRRDGAFDVNTLAGEPVGRVSWV